MKLVLFQTAPGGEISPGVLTESGVADISAAVKKGYTPQLTMQGIIDAFDALRPALQKLADKGAALPLASVSSRPPLPRPEDFSPHCQLLGARPARAAPAQHVHEKSRRGNRTKRHHRAARIHRALDVHARGRACAGDQGPSQDGDGQGAMKGQGSMESEIRNPRQHADRLGRTDQNGRRHRAARRRLSSCRHGANIRSS